MADVQPSMYDTEKISLLSVGKNADFWQRIKVPACVQCTSWSCKVSNTTDCMELHATAKTDFLLHAYCHVSLDML